MNLNDQATPEVLNAIPHRPPFLFVDRVLKTSEDSIEAERTLHKEEFYFTGHYPQMPLMPGVLICESIFQTAGIFLSKTMLQASDVQGKVPVLTRIQEAKFKRMAFPGDTLVLEAKFLQCVHNFYFFKGSAKKDGQTLVSVEFVIGLVPAQQ